MNEERIHELFREMREEPIPTASVQSVQQAVTEQIRRPGSSARRWGWPLGLAAAASIVVLAIFWQASLKPVEPQQITAAPTISTPKPLPALPLEMAQVKTDPPRASSQPVKRVVIAKPVIPPAVTEKKSDDNILIRVETEDPDVVILLVGE